MDGDIKIMEHVMYTVRNSEGKYLMLCSDGQPGVWSDKCLCGCLTAIYGYAKSEADFCGGFVRRKKIKLKTLVF